MKLDTHEQRQAWAFIALCGAGMVFTLFAAFAVWNLRDSAGLSFWLGVLAHIQVFMVLGALGWVLGRRIVVSVGRDGLSKDDSGGE